MIINKSLFEINGPPTNYIKHFINTGEHLPAATVPYRLSSEKKKLLREKLEEMLNENIIEESESPWAAPVVLVPKKDGDVRVCIDYRKLNSITTPDRYPLPRMDDLLHEARSMPFMPSIDLRAGYWQIKVHTPDREKTAFITPFGLYQYKRMQFGLRNAPSTFQRSDVLRVDYLK